MTCFKTLVLKKEQPHDVLCCFHIEVADLVHRIPYAVDLFLYTENINVWDVMLLLLRPSIGNCD